MARPMAHTPSPELEARVVALLPTVARWCARLGGPGVDAEEAAHDVILTVLRKGEPAGSLEAYTYGVTRLIVRNHRRRAWWRRWVPGASIERSSARTPLMDVEGRQTAEAIAGLLETLSDAHREILVLCDVEERSAVEVSGLLGIPEGTVRSRLRLARAAFRERAPAFGLPAPHEEE